RGAGHEAERREGRERNRESPRRRRHDGRDEFPALKHDVRHRDDDADDEGDLNVEAEGLARLRVNQLGACRQRAPGGREDEVDHLIDEAEPDGDADTNGERRSHEPSPEVVKALEEREVLEEPVEGGRWLRSSRPLVGEWYKSHL